MQLYSPLISPRTVESDVEVFAIPAHFPYPDLSNGTTFVEFSSCYSYLVRVSVQSLKLQRSNAERRVFAFLHELMHAPVPAGFKPNETLVSGFFLDAMHLAVTGVPRVMQ